MYIWKRLIDNGKNALNTNNEKIVIAIKCVVTEFVSNALLWQWLFMQRLIYWWWNVETIWHFICRLPCRLTTYENASFSRFKCDTLDESSYRIGSTDSDMRIWYTKTIILFALFRYRVIKYIFKFMCVIWVLK